MNKVNAKFLQWACNSPIGRRTSRNADTFGYNQRSEVVNAGIGTNTAVYAYDEIGNQTYNAVNSLQTAYTANNLNQYSQISAPSASSAVNPTYDSDGNLLSDGLLTYAWDAENRLIAIYSNTTCIVSNAYDHAHRRVLKITPSATHIFIYDGWNLVQETIATATGVSTNQYIWGQDLSDSLQGAGGVGGLLAVVQSGMGFPPVVFLPLYDNNGNIIAYLDESGTAVAEYIYDAFGGTLAATGSLADAFPHRFSTKYYDSETGLYYYGYRFYSPELMRWINRDPIEEQGGLNLYVSVKNNLVNRQDAIGLLSWGHLAHVFNATKTAVETAQKCMQAIRGAFDRRNQGYNDKLNHCLSSCEISEDCNEKIADALGTLKEARDLSVGGIEWLLSWVITKPWEEWVHNHIQGGSFQDSVDDFVANFTGFGCKDNPAGCECCCKKKY